MCVLGVLIYYTEQQIWEFQRPTIYKNTTTQLCGAHRTSVLWHTHDDMMRVRQMACLPPQNEKPPNEKHAFWCTLGSQTDDCFLLYVCEFRTRHTEAHTRNNNMRAKHQLTDD